MTSKVFKIIYLNSPLSGANSAGLAALVDSPSDPATPSTEIFKPQRITSYSISEIINFPNPPQNWDYRLAIKQLVFSKNTLFDSRVEIYMPAYSASPIFNGSSNSVVAATVAVDNTKSVLLSAASTGKIGTTIINRSSKGKLYVSVGNPASLTTYDKILNNAEAYETPFNWSGEVFGIWDKADPNGIAQVKDFS